MKQNKIYPVKTNLIKDIERSHKFFDPDIYHKLENAIKKFGQLKNLIVNKNFEIIDGKYQFQILKNLGYEEIWCCIIEDDIEDVDFSIDIHFKWDYIKASKKIQKALEKISCENLELVSNMHEDEILNFKRILEYDFLNKDIESLYLDYNSQNTKEFF